MSAGTKSKAVEVKSVELCKGYKMVLYSSGSLQLRRTEWPVMGISINKAFADAISSVEFTDSLHSMVDDSAALKGAKAAPVAKVSGPSASEIEAIVARAVAAALASR